MNSTLEVKLLSENAKIPERHHETDAGYDIYASETKILEPQDKAKIKTDVAVNIPKGYIGLLTSRSGVSSKTHLVVETGKIDAGFQGHMKINVKNDIESLENWNSYNFHWSPIGIDGEYIERPKTDENLVIDGCYLINKDDKLAQLVIVPIWTPELQKVDEFGNETPRGENGFGSTGI
ncbi:dUTP diphosphatase [Staphylococcus equorum]|uniref:dUTP diphosphatase n=1 Tax=Staphylococcus equorum TaxID=246432 RepID=UPI00080620DC|nr:dUTP pyrophosphatase [Staphylococcus equorum]ANQ64142.1 dUTP pyrophosphatase [Staphylococcus equorum]